MTAFEEMLELKQLKTTGRGQDILRETLEALVKFGVTDKLFAVTTDGAPAMKGDKDGFYGLLRRQFPKVKHVYCMLHQENLCAKNLGQELNAAADVGTQIINNIRGGNRSLTHRLFKKFLLSRGAPYKDLLMSCEGNDQDVFHHLGVMHDHVEELKVMEQDVLSNNLTTFPLCRKLQGSYSFCKHAESLRILIQSLETKFDQYQNLKICNPDDDVKRRNLLSVFPTTYRCEAAFSTLKQLKPSYRGRLSDQRLGGSMRLALLPTHKEQETFDEEDEHLVRAIVESAAIDVTELDNAAERDPVMKELRTCVLSGKWSSSLKEFQAFKNEFSTSGNLVIRGSKIVVPSLLRPRMLALGHEGHPGETAMKQRLRSRVWWPGMDNDVVKTVKSCEGCRLVSRPDHPEPMTRRELPSAPWVDVAIDFMGPLPSGEHLLVIVDYFSRYKEVEVMSYITARGTTNRLERIFTRMGYPRTITVDNDRQFTGEEFDLFYQERGICINRTTPYWPQMNGEVERQNRSLLKRLKISHALNRNWKQDLQKYLLMYYTTPHTTTGKTPTELCFGRTIRSKIPSLSDVEKTPPSTDYRDRDKILKERGRMAENKKRGAKKSEVQIGDTVLMKNVLPDNKLSTTFGRNKFIVIEKAGSTVKVKEVNTGKTFSRNSSHFKKVLEVNNPDVEQTGTAGI
uniref:RNA-directed DNA polymerase n=1 Tax=Phlebotomus papatasi TaxID=29031 RepID=A0A1B0DDI6_PHLPP